MKSMSEPNTAESPCPTPEERRLQRESIEGYRTLHEISYQRHGADRGLEKLSERLTAKYRQLLLEVIASHDAPSKDDENYRPVPFCPFCPPYCFPLDTSF
jgi:hypothetical protein